jgi:S-DNA-T family DNA segregation ATPase FtsK/SpoIIIE
VGGRLRRRRRPGPLAPLPRAAGHNPTEAHELLADATAAIDVRERWLADHDHEHWDPTPQAPAIVIPVDELAELVEQLPDAATLLDTIARKGRKTAITLLVSTQRPTQEALGGGALRAQLTVRVCLRVTEPADGELVLGRGKARLGYRPDLLDAPGKLLVWDPPDHTRPIPAKVLHLDRARIPRLLAAAGAAAVPELDAATAAALAEPTRRGGDGGPAAHRARLAPAEPAGSAAETTPIPAPTAADGDPLAGLLACLRAAGPRGARVAELAAAIGRAKTWVYERLQDLARAEEVERAGHGRWRLTHPDRLEDDRGDDHGDPEDGHGG